MIPASRARELADAADVELQAKLNAIDSLIRTAAMNGDREIQLFLNFIGPNVYSTTHPMWRALLIALRDYGYTVTEEQVEVGSRFMGLDLHEARRVDGVRISW